MLLVDDFGHITEPLLRSAYVEALYRADDFEFERLTQSFWVELIYKVVTSKSSEALLEKFPVSAEDPTFRRPAVPFECTAADGSSSCGPGTIRFPRNGC